MGEILVICTKQPQQRPVERWSDLYQIQEGSGKVRHLSIVELWVQEGLRKNVFSLRVADAPELDGRWDEVASEGPS